MIYGAARDFARRNARPLDMARFEYHFEGGGAERVVTALSAYQNADGGFAHALEADCWNPHSSPIQTWAAIEVLREVGFPECAGGLIDGALRYLAGGADFSRGKWRNTIKSNDDYPHAPWWAFDDAANEATYNPTVYLAGFALAFAEGGGALWRIAANVVKEAAGAFIDGKPTGDYHALACFSRLPWFCERGGVTGLFDEAALKARLEAEIARALQSAEWQGYYCRPSMFFLSADDPLYAGNEAIAIKEAAMIRETQLADGSWPVPWKWRSFMNEWPVAQSWWRTDIIIKNLRFLRGVQGRL